jgi:hypothetical protein
MTPMEGPCTLLVPIETVDFDKWGIKSDKNGIGGLGGGRAVGLGQTRWPNIFEGAFRLIWPLAIDWRRLQPRTRTAKGDTDARPNPPLIPQHPPTLTPPYFIGGCVGGVGGRWGGVNRPKLSNILAYRFIYNMMTTYCLWSAPISHKHIV